MKQATLRDVLKAGKEVQYINVPGIDGGIEVVGLSGQQAQRFADMVSNKDARADVAMLYASLLKLCCPMFRRWWWTPARIRRKISLKLILDIGTAILKASGYDDAAGDRALKT